jgi:hypothetical protein
VRGGLGAVFPPLSPGLSPPSVSCMPLARRASRLAGWRVSDSWRWQWRDLAEYCQFLYSTTYVIQHPRPATAVHALEVEIQEAGSDWVEGGGAMMAADGVAVRLCRCILPPEALPSIPMFCTGSYCSLQ